MLREVGSGLQTQSAAPSVNIVMRQDGIDRTDIDIVGRTRLYRVLEERFQSEDDILHALDILDAVDELIHGALALGQAPPAGTGSRKRRHASVHPPLSPREPYLGTVSWESDRRNSPSYELFVSRSTDA